ncbi:hypothetical protein [Bordetella tumulicola]|uniref:type III secretion apparatus assembly chaperone SctY n=1 Tax=Bordetella tumulicola TaxID=1649133 RepID=UPI0039EF0922
MSLSTDAHELLGLLAHLYLENNRPEKSVVLLQALDAVGLASRRDNVTLALSLLRTSKPEEAMDVLDRLALNGAVDAPFHLIRSQTLHALDRYAEAHAAMQAYISLRVRNHEDPIPQQSSRNAHKTPAAGAPA